MVVPTDPSGQLRNSHHRAGFRFTLYRQGTGARCSQNQETGALPGDVELDAFRMTFSKSPTWSNDNNEHTLQALYIVPHHLGKSCARTGQSDLRRSSRRPAANDIPIAIPQPLGFGADPQAFASALRRDLELCGWFKVINSAAHLEPRHRHRAGPISLRRLGTDWCTVLAKTRIDNRDGRLRAEVWIYNVIGEEKLGAKAFSATAGNERLLAHKVASEIMLRVTGHEAPFNTRFAVSGNFSGSKEIYMMDFDGNNRVRLTRNGSINLQPAWSPDGSKLAFTSYQSGNPDLYVAELASGRIRRLSSRQGINTGADWHPSGDRLALTLSPNGDPDIYTLHSQSGAQLQRLTKRSGIDVSPVWSPDGSQIAFVSERSGGAQIYVMNADGNGVRESPSGHQHGSNGHRMASACLALATATLTSLPCDWMEPLTRITQSEGNNEDPCWSRMENTLRLAYP